MTEPRSIVLGMAGHIDHGKTALVRALTGVDTDRLPEEKARGITIDLGFASLDLGGATLAVVDVPGHERFIRNMLAGASGFDAALLVVAADDSVMPQTREHLEILGLLGLQTGLITLTKCDLVESSWLNLDTEEVGALVAGTFLEGRPIIRTSAATGLGLDELKASLHDVCASMDAPNDVGPFRMAIDRTFTMAGHGTVVSGTVASGTISVGDEVEWFPPGRLLRVRGLHRHDRSVESVVRGARAAVNVAGLPRGEIGRGHELAMPGYLKTSCVLDVEIGSSMGARRPLEHRERLRLHIGTAEVGATLVQLGDELDGEGKCLARLILGAPVVAVHGEPFVVRRESPSATVGGGRVIGPTGGPVRRRDAESLERLARLRGPEPHRRIEAALFNAGLEPFTEHSLCRETGVALAEIPAILGRLRTSGSIVEIPIGHRAHDEPGGRTRGRSGGRLLRALGRLHASNPRLSAVPRARLVADLNYLKNAPLVSGLIDRLAERGSIMVDGRSVALTGYVASLSQGERRLKAEMAEAYRLGGIIPPEPSDWETSTRTRSSTISEILALLCEEERLVHIAGDLYLDADVVAEIRRRVTDRLVDGSSLTMSELRDLLGTTRKYAVPLGEYLDRIGLTCRAGDVRMLSRPAEEPGALSP